jgi:hypothetical protein
MAATTIPCPHCQGTGSCARCGGSGGGDSADSQCADCKGTGDCRHCDGEGTMPESPEPEDEA